MKKIVLFVTAFLLALLLAACPGVGSSGTGTDPGKEADPSKEEPAIEPPVISTLSVAVIPGANRLTLFWTPAQGAESYEVWYGSSANRGAAAKLDDPVDVDTTAAITGLSGPEPCYIWIQVKNKSGVTGRSRAVKTKLARVFTADSFSADLPSYIAGAPGGSPDSPVPVAISGDLGEANYKKLLTMIGRADKYVALDLSGVTGSGSGAGFRSGGIFDPVIPEAIIYLPDGSTAKSESEQGAAKVAALVLPDAVNKITHDLGFLVSEKVLFGQYTGLRYFLAGELTLFGEWAIFERLFKGLTELRGVSLPVLEVLAENGHFSGCTNLITVSMPAVFDLALPAVDEIHFKRAHENNAIFYNCPNLELVTLSAEIMQTAGSTFGPDNVKARMNLAGEGGARVLAGGTALLTSNGKYMTMAPPAGPYQLDLGNTALKKADFSGDEFITGLVLPATVTSVGFKDCVNLKELTFLRAEPPEQSWGGAFENTPGDLVIQVPAGSLDAYQSTWPGKDIRPIP